MIPLDLTTRKLQAFMAGAVTTTNPTVSVSFYDVPNQVKMDNSEYKRAPQFTVLAGITETDILAAPPQGVVRMTEVINIYNADTVTQDVFVVVDDAGTNRILDRLTLATTESALWTAASGKWNIST